MKQKSGKQSIDVVAALVTERQKYEQWIAALLDKKANTPAKVFDRVYADYTARLEAVMEELSARSTELDGQLEALRAKSKELEDKEAKLREEHSEAELRHAIGEHTADEWRQIVATSNQTIGKLSTERARVGAEIETLQKLVVGIGGDAPAAAAPAKSPPAAPAPAASPPPPTRAPTPPRSSAPVPTSDSKSGSEEKTRWGGAPPAKTEPSSAATSPRQTPTSTPSADLAKSSAGGATPRKPGDPGFDELAFLKSVVPAGTPDPTGARAKKKISGSQPELAIGDQRPPSEPAAAARSGEGPRVAPPADAKPVEQPPTSSKLELPPGSPRDANAPLRSSRVMSESDLGAIGVENLSEAAPAPNETPTFLKNVPSEQTKTLKCGECGAMNYATEWYCEQCGAELSAL